MRGFLIVIASVLLVIGIGVGVIAATTPERPVIQCTSLNSCVAIKRAFGIDTPVLVPVQGSLRFSDGYVVPNTLDWFPDHPNQKQWSVRLYFYDPRSKRGLEWVVDSWPDAPPSFVPGPSWVVGKSLFAGLNGARDFMPYRVDLAM